MEKKNLDLLLVFFFVFSVYLLSSPGPTPYNYFIHLADAFLHKRLYLTKHPPWLNELVPVGKRYYVVYPFLPAILALPLVFLFGPNFNQTLLSIFLGALNTILFFLILTKLKIEKGAKFWLTALFSFGTIHWFTASVGSAWYLAHISAIFFLFLALQETLGKRREIFVASFLGLAFLSRLPTILSFPFFLWHLKRKTSFLLILSIFILSAFLYNFLRFGRWFEFGYSLIPGILNEPWFKKGIIHPSYLSRNLRIFFLGLPKWGKKWPFLQPTWSGLALWITTPAFLFAFKASLREKIVFSSWLAVFLTALPGFCHGSWGFTQFGYRFALDFYPFLLLLTAKGIGGKINWYHQLVIVLSILVNLWGVLWINKFQWVSW